MPNQTPNINLTKPLQTENYDVGVFNGNSDIIDAQIGLIQAGYVKKSGDTMLGDLTVPIVHGSLDGNAATATNSSNSSKLAGKVPSDFTPSGCGWGESILPTCLDCNDYTINGGSYKIRYTNTLNRPFDWGTLIVLNDQTEVSQLAIDIGNNVPYYRSRFNNTWTSWNKIAKFSDIPAALPANGGNSDTVDNEHSSAFIHKAGGTMTGPLLLSSNPTVSLEASTKQYADLKAPGGYGIGGYGRQSGSVDLNTLILCGFYYVNGASLNYPYGNTYGYLLVESVSSLGVKQTFTTLAIGNIFTRVLNNGTWLPWSEIPRIVASSLGISGYIKWSNGYTEQWGVTPAFSNESGQTITFPLQFTTFYNAIATTLLTQSPTQGMDEWPQIYSPTANGMGIYMQTGTNVNFPVSAYWRANGII